MSSRQQLLQQQQQLSQNQGGGGGAAIMFNCSRRELHTPNTGFKQLFRKLRTSFRVDTNKEELSKERLDGVRVLIFGSSTEKLESSECEALRWFLRNGGSVLVMAGDGSHSATGGARNPLLYSDRECVRTPLPVVHVAPPRLMHFDRSTSCQRGVPGIGGVSAGHQSGNTPSDGGLTSASGGPSAFLFSPAVNQFGGAGAGVAAAATAAAEEAALLHNPSLIANRWLEEYGIAICNDSVTRTVYRKDYFHPKVSFATLKECTLVAFKLGN